MKPLLAVCAVALFTSACVIDSPDQIAFVSDRQGGQPDKPDIYLMNDDGTQVTNLTKHAGRNFDPAWSPDGRKIAFDSDRDGDYEIYVMNADGSGQTRLTHGRGMLGCAAGSSAARTMAALRARLSRTPHTSGRTSAVGTDGGSASAE